MTRRTPYDLARIPGPGDCSEADVYDCPECEAPIEEWRRRCDYCGWEADEIEPMDRGE